MSPAESSKPEHGQRSAARIRELDPLAEHEINLVAQRMRDTLVEVEGPDVGAALYSMDWLRERVKWHLNPQTALAKVFLAVQGDGKVIGHTIVRRELDAQGSPYGLFSTTYVVPAARRAGVAHQLLVTGEHWMLDQGFSSAATWTSVTNTKLLSLYHGHGYAKVAQHIHEVTGTVMVKLEKLFSTAISLARRLDTEY